MTVFRCGIFDESHETSSCKNLGFVKFSRINTKNHPFCVNHEIQALSSRRFFSYKRTGVKVNLSVGTDNLFNIDQSSILHSQFCCQKCRDIRVFSGKYSKLGILPLYSKHLTNSTSDCFFCINTSKRLSWWCCAIQKSLSPNQLVSFNNLGKSISQRSDSFRTTFLSLFSYKYITKR